MMVNSIGNGDYIKVEGVNFEDGAKTFEARVACGGSGGADLARLGAKALVVEGQPESGKIYQLVLSGTQAELLPAEEWRGLGTYATAARARERWGNDCTVISIGQAGELQMGAAGVACTGVGEQDCRVAARGGLGALMGSKGLKYVARTDERTVAMMVEKE